MSFGLNGVRAMFQGDMNNVLAGLVGAKCFVYPDDIMVHGYDIDDHIRKLIDILNCLGKFSLKR